MLPKLDEMELSQDIRPTPFSDTFVVKISSFNPLYFCSVFTPSDSLLREKNLEKIQNMLIQPISKYKHKILNIFKIDLGEETGNNIWTTGQHKSTSITKNSCRT